MRLGTFVSHLQGEKEIDIPYNLLFRTDQNPVTFIVNTVLSLLMFIKQQKI